MNLILFTKILGVFDSFPRSQHNFVALYFPTSHLCNPDIGHLPCNSRPQHIT